MILLDKENHGDGDGFHILSADARSEFVPYDGAAQDAQLLHGFFDSPIGLDRARAAAARLAAAFRPARCGKRLHNAYGAPVFYPWERGTAGRHLACTLDAGHDGVCTDESVAEMWS